MPNKDGGASRRGRPPSEAAQNHAAILDAVYALLPERSVRDLTMEAVAKRAGVGKFLACIAQKSLRIFGRCRLHGQVTDRSFLQQFVDSVQNRPARLCRLVGGGGLVGSQYQGCRSVELI
jgi:hypothetical protein